MGLSTLKMYVSNGVSGTTEGVATMDIPEDAEIVGVAWHSQGTDAGGGMARWELSFSSSNGLSTNDTRASISGHTLAIGATAFVSNNATITLDPPVQAAGGDRLYIHQTNSAALDACNVACYIYARTKGVARARRL